MGSSNDSDEYPEMLLTPTEEAPSSKESDPLTPVHLATRSGWRPPVEFATYIHKAVLGLGGTGQVHRYWDSTLERDVAIKFLKPDREHLTGVLRDEARTMAKLKHENILSVYAAGEVAGFPYIVSEYIEGISIDRIVPMKPWSRVMQVALDLARGLDAAHQLGIVHGDIKPANAVLDVKHEVCKLIDFGLARRVADTFSDELSDEHAGYRSAIEPRESSRCHDSRQRRAIRGTLGYMAPELWAGGSATKRSDVYAFGVMLIELCTGRRPWRNSRIAWQSQDVDHETIMARLEVQLATLVPGLAAIVRKCLAPRPEHRYESAAEVRIALEKLSAPIDMPSGNPYRWLRPFSAEHQVFFFGRSSEIWRVVDRMRESPFALLTGGSGVGKSSLARAGIVPQIEEGALGDGRAWQSLTMIPGSCPLATLGQQLARRLEGDETEIIAIINERDFMALRRRIREFHGHKRGTLLLVDQLDELVTMAGSYEREAVSEVLASLISERTPGVKVLATARIDRVDRLARLPGLGPLLQEATYLVNPLEAASMREAIVEPARLLGVEYECSELVDELVATLVHVRGGLPLLQFTLSRLWQSRDVQRGLITRAALDELGGVQGALTQHADQVLQTVLPSARGATREVLIRLVSLDGTRARKTRDELQGSSPERKQAVEALIRGRLIVVDERGGEMTCELVHESLVTAWRTLREWLDEAGSTRAIQNRLEQAAARWEAEGRPRAMLWRVREVHGARELDTEALSATGREFLASSRRSVRRRRWLLGFALSAPLITALTVYAWMWFAGQPVIEQKQQRTLDAVAQKTLLARHGQRTPGEGRASANALTARSAVRCPRVCRVDGH